MEENVIAFDEKEELSSAISKAHILLSYACQEGLDVEEATVKSIVESVELKSSKKRDLTLEKDFWQAYSNLSKIVEPVNISSLEAVRGIKKQESRLGSILIPKALKSKKVKSVARKSVDQYRALFLVTMFLMLFIQIYWVVGLKLIKDSGDISLEIDSLAAEIEKIERDALSDVNLADNKDIIGLESMILEKEGNLAIRYNILLKWNRVWQFLPRLLSSRSEGDATPAKLDRFAAFQSALLQAKFVSDAIGQYLLPLMYGLLGPFAFVLRRLSEAIKNLLYTEEMNINYSLRLHLGALSGLAIGWFYTSDTQPQGLSLDSLSPLALAFLAGYSVELLFTVMDRLIVKDKAQPAKSSKN